MSTAPPPLPLQPEVETEASSGGFRISSGTWVVLAMSFLGVFAGLAALLYWHNLNRRPLDFWGFDSHRIIRTAPVVKATLIRPDPLSAPTPATPGDQVWHDDLFMMVENRYLVEGRADVADYPEFRLLINNGDSLKRELEQIKESSFPENFQITNQAELDKAFEILAEEKPDKAHAELKTEVDYVDFDEAKSIRQALRANRSYDWQAFPWEQEPQWRYALTFAKEETTAKGTKHELTRTFTFTLVFDQTCRWVTLQSVAGKLTAVHPNVQRQLQEFFLGVFPGSDQPLPPLVPSATPAPSPTATPSPTSTPIASAAPSATATVAPSPTTTSTSVITGPLPTLPPAGGSSIGGPIQGSGSPQSPTSPLGTGMNLGSETLIREGSPATGVAPPPLTTLPSLTTSQPGGAPGRLQLTPSPLLQPSSIPAPPNGLSPITLPPIALPSGTLLPMQPTPPKAEPNPTATPSPTAKP
jgi:hypothetical protein